jgi:hypothetical protein
MFHVFELLAQLEAGHFRHDDIQQDQVREAVLEDRQRRGCAVGFGRRVARLTEVTRQQHSARAAVIDHQDDELTPHGYSVSLFQFE